ncbi:MAG: hypothetical protein AB1726_10765 [Planctomycetota bacterium]
MNLSKDLARGNLRPQDIGIMRSAHVSIAGLVAILLAPVVSSQGTGPVWNETPTEVDPSHLILSAETVADQGAIRIFDARTGAFLRSFSHPAWIDGGKGRSMAVDRQNDRLVVGDDKGSGTTLYFFDCAADHTFMRQIDIDISPSGGRSGPGLRGMAFGPDPRTADHLYVAGCWSSGSSNWLFEVDPTTGQCESYLNLDSIPELASFEANAVSTGATPVLLGGGWRTYVSEWGSPGGRIAVFKKGLLSALEFDRVLAPVELANRLLNRLSVLDDASILVERCSDHDVCWSDISQTAWLETGLMGYGGLAAIGTQTRYFGASGTWPFYRTFSSHWPWVDVDPAAGGRFTTSTQRVAIR